jgi:putative transcriptional regulator
MSMTVMVPQDRSMCVQPHQVVRAAWVDIDPAKAGSNPAKNGIEFTGATEVFDDPDVYITPNPRPYGESRFQAISMVKGELALIVYTVRGGVHRIIARAGQIVVKERLMRYRPGIDPQPGARTDWERVRSMTDEEVETAALSDPDAQPLAEEELAQGFRPGRLIAARRRLGLSQAAYAGRFHINLRTLQDWEQARRVSDQVAHAYLRVIAHNADVVVAALGTDPRQQ